mgnify:CR=1 FL=1
MNALTKTLDIPAFDPISYDAAVRAATIRAQHSFFDQHVIEDDEGCFVADRQISQQLDRAHRDAHALRDRRCRTRAFARRAFARLVA